MSTARSVCFFCYIYPSIFPKNELIWHDEDHQCGHELAGWAEREYERFTLSWCPLTTWLRSCRSVETAKSTFLRNTEALQKELGDENFFQSVLTQGFTTDSSKLLFLFGDSFPLPFSSTSCTRSSFPGSSLKFFPCQDLIRLRQN